MHCKRFCAKVPVKKRPRKRHCRLTEKQFFGIVFQTVLEDRRLIYKCQRTGPILTGRSIKNRNENIFNIQGSSFLQFLTIMWSWIRLWTCSRGTLWKKSVYQVYMFTVYEQSEGLGMTLEVRLKGHTYLKYLNTPAVRMQRNVEVFCDFISSTHPLWLTALCNVQVEACNFPVFNALVWKYGPDESPPY